MYFCIVDLALLTQILHYQWGVTWLNLTFWVIHVFLILWVDVSVSPSLFLTQTWHISILIYHQKHEYKILGNFYVHIKIDLSYQNIFQENKVSKELRGLGGSVIKINGRVEFEDGLRMGVHLGGCWCPSGGRTYPRINFNSPGGAGWSWVGHGCHKDPISDQILTCLVPHISGIKLQLSCGVRIESD